MASSRTTVDLAIIAVCPWRVYTGRGLIVADLIASPSMSGQLLSWDFSFLTILNLARDTERLGFEYSWPYTARM